jgi:hypothetical protein
MGNAYDRAAFFADEVIECVPKTSGSPPESIARILLYELSNERRPEVD